MEGGRERGRGREGDREREREREGEGGKYMSVCGSIIIALCVVCVLCMHISIGDRCLKKMVKC